MSRPLCIRVKPSIGWMRMPKVEVIRPATGMPETARRSVWPLASNQPPRRSVSASRSPHPARTARAAPCGRPGRARRTAGRRSGPRRSRRARARRSCRSCRPRVDVAADRQPRRDRLDDRLDRLGRARRRRARSGTGSSRPGPGCAAACVDRDRLAVQRSARPRRASATAPRSKRARKASCSSGRATVRSGRRPSVSSIRVPGRISSSGDRLRDQRRGGLGIAPADARAQQRPVEASPSPSVADSSMRRAFGRFGERRDEIVRRHPPAGRRALGERRDALARAPRPTRRRPAAPAPRRRSAVEARRQHPGRGAQRGAGRERRATSRATADPRAEIGHPVDPRRSARSRSSGDVGGARHERTAERRARRAARQFQALIIAQEHACPPRIVDVADPPRREVGSLWRRHAKVKLTGCPRDRSAAAKRARRATKRGESTESLAHHALASRCARSVAHRRCRAPMLLAMTASRSRVTAVLGPTNTGKTHLAIERMCGAFERHDRLSAAAAGARGL